MYFKYLSIIIILSTSVLPLQSLRLAGDVQDVIPELQELFNGDLETWEAPIEIQKKYVYYQSGFNEDNHPVWVQELGKWDIRDAVERGGQYLEDFDKYCDQWIYRVLNSTYTFATPEAPISHAISIHDLEGYTAHQFSSAATIAFFVKKCSKLGVAMRIMDVGYMLNVNFLAEKLTRVIKPFFGPDVARMDVFGTNKNIWIPKLLKKIPKDQLPTWYGGSEGFKAIKVYG